MATSRYLKESRKVLTRVFVTVVTDIHLQIARELQPPGAVENLN